MRVQRLVLGELDTNCWLVDDGLPGRRPLLVVDPAGDPRELLAAVGDRGVSSIVLTHGHFDHLGAADAIREDSRAPLAVHAADADWITSAEGTGGMMFGFAASTAPADRILHDGDSIEAGQLRLGVLHTPGHTPGSICLLVERTADEPPHLFAGDTLFAGSVGRSDFPGGDGRALSRSIAERIAPLPADTIVHPGHGPDTTVGREVRVNPFFPRV